VDGGDAEGQPMMVRSLIATWVLVAAAAHGDARPATTPRDACDLLTKREVAAVQGQPFATARPTTRGTRSQCFFELPAFVDSVSLDVIRDGDALWKEYFALEAQDQRERSRAEQGKSRKSRPHPVRGIGQEAYWVGGNSTGSLYVLKNGVVLRVSVGGGVPEAEKIKRSKALAAKALARL
jgi:hypothetical protein